MILSVQDLHLSFGTHSILNQFSFELKDGEIACLLGASGCGKTTALRAIAGFEMPQSGKIILKDTILSDGHHFIEPHQRKIGMVFQDYALFPHLTVEQNIAFGLAKHSRSEQRQRTNELLDLIGLGQYAKRYPHQLSGGQQQRIALARALAPKPQLILLDEPFSNLDSDLRARLSKEVRQLLKQEHTSALMVTHDQQEAFAIADKIGIMSSGRLKQWSSPTELYHRPNNPEVALFLGQGVLLNGKPTEQGVALSSLTIHGDLPESCRHSSEVNILIRPHDIKITPNAPSNATVTDLDFQGSHTTYTLTLDSGEVLPASFDRHHQFSIGNRLAIHVAPHELVAFPHNTNTAESPQ